MAKTDFKSVDEYIAAQPAANRASLALVRRTILAALPGAEEMISYQMPTYRLGGKAVIHFAGWKQHFSLYPVGPGLVAELGEDVAPYPSNGRGTLRFSLAQPVPVALLTRIAKLRDKEAKSDASAKSAKPK